MVNTEQLRPERALGGAVEAAIGTDVVIAPAGSQQTARRAVAPRNASGSVDDEVCRPVRARAWGSDNR